MDEKGHLTIEERDAYWRRTLAPAALLEVSDHLQDCAQCREELQRARPAKTDSETHVVYEDLVSALDDDLDPLSRRELSERINASPAAAELTDLLRFRDEMNRLPARDYAREEEPSGRFSWVLPIAAGLALGFVFLWWTSVEHRTRGGIVLRDAGHTIVVRRSGQIQGLGPLPADLQSAVRSAAAGHLVLPPALARLRGKGEILAGGGREAGGFKLIAPLGTVVASRQPTFRWERNARATGYRLNLVARSSGQLVSSPVLDGAQTEWIPQAPLQPNESYEWEVEALRHGEMIGKAPAPPAPEARFAILPNEKREALEKLRARFGRSHLLMGIAYAEAGLVPEAQAEFETLARENPHSTLPRKLLARLTNAAE